MALELNYQTYGEQGPDLVIVHGLFGSARNWNSLAQKFAEQYRVFVVDLRNHGQSPWADSMSYPDMAEDLKLFIEQHCNAPVRLLGHSMGGKAAMTLTLLYPALVERLLVLDVSPVAYKHSFLPYVQAMRKLDFSQIKRRNDADAALKPAIKEFGVRQFLLQNLATENGTLSWRVNLDVLETYMESITGFPERAFEPALMRTLFLGGDRSDYIKEEYLPQIRALFPSAEVDFIADAGHWVHAEQPERLLERMQTW